MNKKKIITPDDQVMGIDQVVADEEIVKDDEVIGTISDIIVRKNNLSDK